MLQGKSYDRQKPQFLLLFRQLSNKPPLAGDSHVKTCPPHGALFNDPTRGRGSRGRASPRRFVNGHPAALWDAARPEKETLPFSDRRLRVLQRVPWVYTEKLSVFFFITKGVWVEDEKNAWGYVTSISCHYEGVFPL